MTETYSPKEEEVLAQQLEFITPLYCRMWGEWEGKCFQGLPVPDLF